MIILVLATVAALLGVAESTYGNPTTEILLKNYDATVPPGGVKEKTVVQMALEFATVNEIIEKQM